MILVTAINLNIGQEDYTISENGEYYFYNSGTYEIKIFGSSGNGCKDSSFSIAGTDIGVGGGGGGGAFGYFRINMTGNDAENNKVKITYDDNNDFTVEIKSRNPKNEEVWQAEYNVTAGEDGQNLLNNLTTATGGTINFISGSSLEKAEFLEYAFGSAGTNGQNATGKEFNIGLGTINYSVSGGEGGSYTASDGKTYKGFPGGNGIINTVISGINQSASDGQKGKIIITRVSNSNPGTGTEGGSGTNPDPETPGDSTTTPNILTKKSIQELKTKINTELQRRCYYGNISSAGYEVDGITDKKLNFNQKDPAITDNINNNLIDPINLIFIDKNGIIQNGLSEIEKVPISYSYINTIENKLDSIGPTKYPASNVTGKDAAHGCKNLCTGFCSSTCGSGCRGNCGESCSLGCGAKSGGTSSPGSPASCDSCGTSCSVKCGDCTSACSGTCGVGCGPCSAFCSSVCSACSSECTGGSASSIDCMCSGLCSTACTKGCYGCNTTCEGSCGSKDCNSGCSVECGSSCTATCGGCGNTCGSGSATPATEAGCNSCYGDCQSCGSECTGSCRKKCEGTCLNTCKDYCSASSKSS